VTGRGFESPDTAKFPSRTKPQSKLSLAVRPSRLRVAAYAAAATRLGRPFVANDFEAGAVPQGFMAELSRNRDPSRAEFAIRADAAVFTLPTIACSRAVRTGVGAGLTISGRGRERAGIPTLRPFHSDRNHRTGTTGGSFVEGAGSIGRYPTELTGACVKAVQATFVQSANRQVIVPSGSPWMPRSVLARVVRRARPHRCGPCRASRLTRCGTAIVQGAVPPRQTCGAVVWRWPCP
jgi:hypothetical protein